jgi:NitT/TauT family transport system ATP-binding protein
MAESFIHIAGMQKVYRTRGADFLAISEVTFDVAAGELVSLVGPSGCGKTTLLKILAGLQPYDSGVLSLGSRTQPFDPSRDIGMVFQQPLLLKWRRVIDNVLLPAEILGLSMTASRARARDLLALVGLKGNEDKYPYELSGGMQQRAAIARALVHDPKLILMDEPFGALDALTREKMNLELLRIWERAKKTIVFVTHGISEAVFLGTRVVVLTAGPARMADNFRVELPYPRSLEMKTNEKFGEYARRIYRLLGMECRYGAATSRHHHERRHRPHGDEPALDPLDRRDPRAGRRAAQERRPGDAGPDPGRPQ